MNQTNDINKTIDRATRRLRFFATWYCSLTDQERDSWLGTWILERGSIFTGIIKEEMARHRDMNTAGHLQVIMHRRNKLKNLFLFSRPRYVPPLGSWCVKQSKNMNGQGDDGALAFCFPQHVQKKLFTLFELSEMVVHIFASSTSCR